MLLALRINVLAKGHSGISLNTLQQYVAAFNGIYIYVNLLGSLYALVNGIFRSYYLVGVCF